LQVQDDSVAVLEVAFFQALSKKPGLARSVLRLRGLGLLLDLGASLELLAARRRRRAILRPARVAGRDAKRRAGHDSQ
jgi:hypothetical protein